MCDKAELVAIARRLAFEEGPRRTAGRLFNLAALLLAETGMTEDELSIRLRLAFMRFDQNELDAAIARSAH